MYAEDNELYTLEPVIVDISFVNGYLAPIALFMDCLNQELGFTYYFRELHRVRTNDRLPTVVRRTLKTSFADYNARGGRLCCSDDHFKSRVARHCSLKQLESWEQSLPRRISYWVCGSMTEDVEETTILAGPWTWIPIREDFMKVLTRFFRNEQFGGEPVECWFMEGHILGELHYFWGGVAFDDYFFAVNGRYFHLHFHMSD